MFKPGDLITYGRQDYYNLGMIIKIEVEKTITWFTIRWLYGEQKKIKLNRAFVFFNDGKCGKPKDYFEKVGWNK